MNKNLLFVLCLFAFVTFSQKKTFKTPTYKKMMNDMTVNFYAVCDSADAYFKTIDKDVKGSGYKPYMRWRDENENRYAPSGNRLIDESVSYKEYLRLKKESDKLIKFNRSSNDASGWKSLGPDEITKISGHYAPGLGRLEFVEVNKTNQQEIYVGSRSGGLWHTNNGGITWTHNTDFLPGSGVNAISANPTNFNEVYINSRMASSGTSFGIYKSTDNGSTFTPTNFVPSTLNLGGLGSTFKVNTIQHHPTIPNLIFVGTSKGLFRSTNNLQTWTQLYGTSGNILDIDFHPTDSNIVYIYDHGGSSNKNRILKSVNIGVNFTQMPTITGNDNVDLKIITASSCPDCVFLTSDNGIWKSTDSGATFSTVVNPAPAGISLSGVMPNDNDVTKFVGGYQDLFRSEDSGTTFAKCTWWSLGSNEHGPGTYLEKLTNSNSYVHADTNYLDCINGVFYSCSDGFLSKSSDNGATWQKLSYKMGIRENYCLGVSQSDNSVAICGSQDNGISIVDKNGWTEAYGADGMEGIVTPLNPLYKIGSTQNGSRRRFLDENYISGGATPDSQTGAWIAPMFYDPNNQMTVYSIGEKIHKSTDFGTTWTILGSPVTFTGKITDAAIAENNSNKIAISTSNHLELSVDGGVTFASILNNLPPSLNISDVTFDPNNDETMVVTYVDVAASAGANKVFITYNGGTTWENITYNLGLMPINCAEISKGIIYVGAEMGVYYKPIAANTWTLLNNNLPNVAVKELEVNYGANTIKAATWGRGLWESKLVNRENFPAILTTEISNPPTFTLPKVTMQQFVTSTIDYAGTLTSVKVFWALNTPTFNTTDVISMSLVSGNTWKSNTAIPDQPVGTKVFFKVEAIGSNSDVSETYKFMYEVKPFVYCAASGENENGALWINNFTLGGTTVNTNAFNGGYSNNTTNLFTVNAGSTYTATGNFSTGWGENDFMVWIDYNADAEFSLSERVIYDINTGFNSSQSFIVPANTTPGTYRMRVRLGYWGDYNNACATTLGEVEDYQIKIEAALLNNETFNNTNQFKAYPNPITNELILENNSNSDKVNFEIFNVLGQIVTTGEFINKTVINTDNFSKGNYFVKIKQANTIHNLKIIK
jgi:hypothetical protein